MEIPFEVDGLPSVYRRNDRTGRAELHVGSEVIDIQSPFRLSTHFTVRTRTGWRYEVHGHEVEIVKVLRRVWGGFRANFVHCCGRRASCRSGVRKVTTTPSGLGWRPSTDEQDRHVWAAIHAAKKHAISPDIGRPPLSFRRAPLGECCIEAPTRCRPQDRKPSVLIKVAMSQ